MISVFQQFIYEQLYMRFQCAVCSSDPDFSAFYFFFYRDLKEFAAFKFFFCKFLDYKRYSAAGLSASYKCIDALYFHMRVKRNIVGFAEFIYEKAGIHALLLHG